MEPTSQPLTYDEAAALLGVLPETVRRMARLKHWRRLPGNDGKARLIIPPHVLASAQAATGGEGGGDPGGSRGGKLGRRRGGNSRAAKGADAGAATRAESAALAALAEHIARLGRELDTARIVVTAAQGEATAAKAESERLRADLDAATVVAERLQAVLALTEGERDRWRSEATKPLLARLFGRRRAA